MTRSGVLDLAVALHTLDGIEFDVGDSDQPPIAADAGAYAAPYGSAAAGAHMTLRARALSELSPLDSLDRVLAAVDDTEANLHAWATLDRDGARRQALAAARRLDAGSGRRPLDGITVGVKDIIDVADLPCSANFAPFADRVPQIHAVVVQRLVDAGAVILGKTVTTQFAFSDPAETANPWNLKRTPGGSSSGSAVAVAARHCDAALGSQTAGSTIRPAAYCGVIGFKPSRGRISRGGVFPLAWSLDEVGILARDVATAAGVFACASQTAPTVVATAASSELPSRRLRIAVVDDLVERAAGETAEAVRRVATKIAESGGEVDSVSGPDAVLVQVAHKVIMSAEMAAVHRQLIELYRPHYGPLLAEAVTTARAISASQYLSAQRLRALLDATVRARLGSVDAWLLPSVRDVAPPRTTTGDRSMQLLASLLGLPAITIPAALSTDRLPIGVQLVAGRGHDEDLLDIARRVSSMLACVDWTSATAQGKKATK